MIIVSGVMLETGAFGMIEPPALLRYGESRIEATRLGFREDRSYFFIKYVYTPPKE